MDWVESQQQAYPALSDRYGSLGELYSKKLWHQLTTSLEEFLSDPRTKVGDNWAVLYSNFIANFQARLNPVRLTSLVSTIGHSFEDAGKTVELFEEVLKNRDILGDDATLCLEMDTIIARMRLNQVSECKSMLSAARQKMSSMSSPPSIVFSKFYKASAEYRRVAGPPQEFYNAALMFIAYTPMDELPATEAATLGKDMALASITGENIFNFGEVLATPILGALKGTQDEWLGELVLALHHGSIAEFNACVDSHRPEYFAHAALANSHEDVKKKVVLLALMNIAFERGSNDRTISFKTIAERTCIPEEQVEWVLMRAMSLKLIRGSIDQVGQSVDISWVQPRILDKQQLGVICEQLDGWTEKVKAALVTVEDQTPELYN